MPLSPRVLDRAAETRWPWLLRNPPRSRITFAIVMQALALPIIVFGGSYVLVAVGPIAGSLGLLVGYLRETAQP